VVYLSPGATTIDDNDVPISRRRPETHARTEVISVLDDDPSEAEASGGAPQVVADTGPPDVSPASSGALLLTPPEFPVDVLPPAARTLEQIGGAMIHAIRPLPAWLLGRLVDRAGGASCGGAPIPEIF
jgi:hypothetical protein